MLAEPRQRADGTWGWSPVFRPRGCARPFTPRPVRTTPAPLPMSRVAALVHLSCRGYHGHVTFAR